jgi:branched-chain amino acid transport system substrate-binding protein
LRLTQLIQINIEDQSVPKSGALSWPAPMGQRRPRLAIKFKGHANMRASIVLATSLAIALCAASARAQQPDKAPATVKLGVLSDMSGLYADIGGQGSVIAARMAVEDFNPASHDMKVEIVSADHQNKPDVGSAIARRWYDVDHVNAIADVPNSGVALAVSNVTREKNGRF